jgi:thiamine kinase-like enzyme
MTNSLENIVEQWRQWNIGLKSKPIIDHELFGSSSNTSFILNGSLNNGMQQRLVLRIHKDNPLFQADRQQEYIIQQAVNNMGAAPEIIYQHPDGHYRLSEYIEGESFEHIFTRSNSHHPAKKKNQLIEALCLTLKNIHQLKLPIADFSYSNCIQNYGRILFSHTESQTAEQALLAMQQRQTKMLAICKDYENQYGANARVPCHIDLNANNILLARSALLANPDNRGDPNTSKPCIMILDWEFAGNGIASMDFAAIASELQLDITQVSMYSGIGQKELNCAQQIYQYTCEIYNRALALESP